MKTLRDELSKLNTYEVRIAKAIHKEEIRQKNAGKKKPTGRKTRKKTADAGRTVRSIMK